MVGRSRVAAYTDVPITGARNACTGGRLVRRRRAGKRVIQCDHVLLIQRSDTARTHTDVVRAVPIDDVVFQLRIRDRPAGPIGGGVCTGALVMTPSAPAGR